MFKKLVTNIPFNPGLLPQISFYSNRLKKERSVRRIGVVFMAITLTVQTLVFITPPERSLASSSNHIINGLRTKNDILNAWDQPGSDVPAIYGTFGLTRADIASLPNQPNAKISSTSADYWSIGRNSLSGYSGVSQNFKNSQISLQYSGKDTASSSDDRYVYQRSLRAWDIRNPSNSYRAFEGKMAKTGEKFWILIDCGNFTKIGKTTPPPVTPTAKLPKPELEIKKSIENKPDNFKPGDAISYKISFRNKVKDTQAENVVIEDQLDTKLFNVPDTKTDTYTITNGFFRYERGNLPYTPHLMVVPLKVTLRDQINSGSTICNQARVTADNSPAKTSNKACVGVINPCPFDDSIADENNPNCTEPKLVCSVVDFALNRTTRRVSYKTTVSSSNPSSTTIKSYSYDFGDSAIEQHSSSLLMHSADHVYQPGSYEAEVTVHFMTKGQEESGNKSVSCVANIDFEDDQPLGQSKSVTNITQDLKDDLAVNSLVNGGDVLEYTIGTTNPQNYKKVGVDVSDYIGDILDYADLDTAFLEQQGGSFDSDTNKVNWTDLSIPASSTADYKFRVTIKQPIPSTNQPSTVGTSYDCKISNEYGNEITMDINCPLVKGLETLPNTGPGSSMLFSVVSATVIGYFYARSRLLAKEVSLVKASYTGGA